MINLLAYERKSEIRAARANVILWRYIVILLLAFLFIAGALYVSYTVLQSTMQSADNVIATNNERANVYNDTKQQVQKLSNTLNEANVAFGQEIHYSQLLTQLGQQLPAGAVLGEITLNNASFAGTPTEIKAYVKTVDDVTTLQSGLEASSLFSTVTLQSTDDKSGIANYPVLVSFLVTLNKAAI
ncbi:MAG: PilN domain-containing protein [Candidatus Microsaccharimonas sp.]